MIWQGVPVSDSINYTLPMKVTTIRSVGRYLATIAKIRKGWKVPKHLEIWFRAEDAEHHSTRLQPSVCRQRDSGLRKSADKLLEIENDLYEESRRCATQLSMADLSAIDDEWDSYFLMQHHGCPTRLLDWTDGALIALHFAIRNKKSKPQSGSVIYVLDPYWV